MHCRMAAQAPYPAYGLAWFCRPDKRSAIRQFSGTVLMPDGGVPPYPAYGLGRCCRPDKRSAIRQFSGTVLIAGWRRKRLIRPTG